MSDGKQPTPSNEPSPPSSLGDDSLHRESNARLFQQVYEELHALAQSKMAGQRASHTLQATALVNEVFLRIDSAGTPVVDQEHFLCLAARAMRQVLVDHGRRKSAGKRAPDSQRLNAEGILDRVAAHYEESSSGLLALDSALLALEGRDPELAQLVELHSFGGLSLPDCALAMGISTRTAERWWRVARGTLKIEIDRILDAPASREAN